MYLIDTNVWLERLLDQAKSEQVGRFLEQISSDRFFVTDFSFHSICVILDRLEQLDSLLRFAQDVFVDGGVSLIRLEPDDTTRLVSLISQTKLDFDDAYQYIAAERYGLTIVSFDGDFDQTERGRQTPDQVVVD